MDLTHKHNHYSKSGLKLIDHQLKTKWIVINCFQLSHSTHKWAEQQQQPGPNTKYSLSKVTLGKEQQVTTSCMAKGRLHSLLDWISRWPGSWSVEMESRERERERERERGRKKERYIIQDIMRECEEKEREREREANGSQYISIQMQLQVKKQLREIRVNNYLNVISITFYSAQSSTSTANTNASCNSFTILSHFLALSLSLSLSQHWVT